MVAVSRTERLVGKLVAAGASVVVSKPENENPKELDVVVGRVDVVDGTAGMVEKAITLTPVLVGAWLETDGTLEVGDTTTLLALEERVMAGTVAKVTEAEVGVQSDAATVTVAVEKTNTV